jgi:fibronectin-binding autotransporter adhesin
MPGIIGPGAGTDTYSAIRLPDKKSSIYPGSFVVTPGPPSVYLTNTFEGGSDGTTITTGNSGGTSGSAFGFINIPTSAAVTYSAANAGRGSLGASVSIGATTGQVYLQYTSAILGSSSSAPVYVRLRMKLSANPVAPFRFTVIADSVGAFQGDYRINTNGTLGLYTGTGTLIGNTTNAITPGQWFDVGISVQSFSSTTGVTELKLFLNPASDVATETITGTSRDTLRGGGANSLQMGIITSGITSQSIYFDDIQVSNQGYPLPLGAAPSAANIDAGTITLSGQSTLTATGFQEQFGGSNLSGQSTLAAAGVITQLGTASLSGQSTLTVAGLVSRAGSAALTAQSQLTVAGSATTSGVASMSGQSTLLATGSGIVSGAASLTAQSNLTAAGARTVSGDSALSGQFTLTMAGTVTKLGISSLSGQTSLTASGVAASSGISSLSGQSTLVASGVVTKLGVAGLTAQSNLTANGTASISGTASLTGQSSLTSAGIAISSGAATMTAQSSLSATGIIGAVPVTVTMTGQSNVPAIVATVTALANSAMSGQSTLTAATKATANASAALTGQSTLTANGVATKLATSSLSGQSTLVATGTVTQTPAGSNMTGQSTMTVAGKVTAVASTNLSAQTSLTATIKATTSASAVLSGQSTLTAGLTRVQFGTLTLSAQSSASIAGNIANILNGLANLSATLILDVDGFSNPPWVFPYIEFKPPRVIGTDSSSTVSGERNGSSSVKTGMESKQNVIIMEGG